MGGTRPSENPSMDFLKDCRTASQFCMLLSRPSMGSLGLSSSQVISSMDFRKDCRITINRHPELVSGSVPPFIRGSTRLPTMVRQAHQPWFDKITILYIRYTSSREIRYAKKGAAGAGRARRRRVAERSGAMEANAGTLQAPHTGNARQQRSSRTAKPSAAIQKTRESILGSAPR